jgi:hypothetical protein
MLLQERARADFRTLWDGLKAESSGTEDSPVEALERPLPLPRSTVLMGGKDNGGEDGGEHLTRLFMKKSGQLVRK